MSKSRMDEEKFSTLPQDQRCPICTKYKFRSPRCGCGGPPSKGDDKASGGSPASFAFENDTATKSGLGFFATNAADNSLKLTISAPALEARLPTLEELLKLLTVSFKDGTLYLTAQENLSPEQKQMLQLLFKEIKNHFEQFVQILKQQNISIAGYKLESSDKQLSISIPDREQLKNFIQRLVDKKLLHPEHQRALLAAMDQYTSPTPFKKRLERK